MASGWRVTDQRETYSMASGGRFVRSMEVTVSTDIGPSFTVEVPLATYGDTEATKALIQARYDALAATHQLTG